MDFEFSSLDELFKRVTPALHAKEVEFKRLGYSNIKSIDIWNYLVREKWMKGNGLMLSDIVNDIMTVSPKKIDFFLKGKISRTRRTEYFDENLEI